MGAYQKSYSKHGQKRVKKVTDQRKRVKQLIQRDKSKYLDEKTVEIELANKKGHTLQTDQHARRQRRQRLSQSHSRMPTET